MAPEPGAYDAILSMDTLYWASDLDGVLRGLSESLAPGGRMALFLNHHIGPGEPARMLAAGNSWPGQAIDRLGFGCEVVDFTANVGAFWERNHAAALDPKLRVEEEGNGFIAESLIRESEEDYLPDIHEGRISRHLFVVEAPA
ncbi:MAG: class I SAM-dependent methyltransferase [Silicimonas sp.]|nr:class I SAM-dependent methyltransferase [Silicimonas sp.]